MAQESGSGRQNKTIEFLQNNPIYVIVGLLAVLTIVYFIATSGNDNGPVVTTETPEQTGQNQPSENQPSATPNGQTPTESPNGTQAQTSGNVTATGTLRASDNAARGNLMVESSSGKVYVSTGRDFSSLIGTQVTLNAEGSLNNFVFLGFNDSKVAGTDTTAVGGSNEAGNVAFSGTLRTSDNTDKGNYVIHSGSSHVYLQTVRDYSAWVGQDVVLNATGSLDSFYNAVLTQK